MIIQISPDANANILLKLTSMQEQGEFCDFTLFVSGLEIKAHKCMLAACSEYFQTSFRFNDSGQSLDSLDLTHLGCDHSVVERVIRSFYTNEIDIDFSCIERVLTFADYLVCENLRLSIEAYMEKTLTFNNVISYFQLALQYRLHSTGLLNRIRSLLTARFHDYFIYQQDALDANMETIKAFISFGVFSHCNPLQIVEYLLNNAQQALTRFHQSDVVEHCTRDIECYFDETFRNMFHILDEVGYLTVSRWQAQLVQLTKKWSDSNQLFHKHLSALQCHLKWLEIVYSHEIPDHGVESLCGQGKDCHVCFHKLIALRQDGEKTESTTILAKPDSPKQVSLLNQDSSVAFQDGLSSPNLTSVKPSTLQLDQKLEQDSKVQLPVVEMAPGDVSVTDSSCKPTERKEGISTEAGPQTSGLTMSKIIAVLAPSREMTAQLMVTDAGESRPLIKSPQLELAFYDIEKRTWRKGCQFNFPISGAMLDKHSWRMTFLNDCLYLFSLTKQLALEFHTIEKKWTHLDGKQLFLPHLNNSPVKSIIPVAVGDKLIVLSMSREAQANGEFCTQQHFFEMNHLSKTFSCVASVQDNRLDLPITQWTVDGNVLITVKASTMVYRQLSHIQYIHVYDAETRSLETHEVFCAMAAGVKVLATSNTVYLLDSEGWCRAYNLQTSEWKAVTRYQCQGLYSADFTSNSEDVYPALTHVTCHAGSSRWEITTHRKSVSSRMQETVVYDGGELNTYSHPPPPFEFMTAMSPSVMCRSTLDKMPFSKFTYSENQMLDFFCRANQ